MILPQVTQTLLTSSMTHYVWMQCILHSPDTKILKEKGWLKCPGIWHFVMLALLPCFEMTKRVHTWTSKFPFWSQTRISILRFFFPYHHLTCLTIVVLRHRSLRIVLRRWNTISVIIRLAKDHLFYTLVPKQEKVSKPLCTHHVQGHFWSILKLLAWSWACTCCTYTE